MKKQLKKTGKSIGKSISILMSITMVMGLCMVPASLTKAAGKGYDIFITKVGLYKSEGKNMVYAEYCNGGDVDADTDFTMTFQVDSGSKITARAEADGLKPHETKRVSAVVSQTIENSKKYEIMAVADVQDDIRANNNRTSFRKIQVSEPGTIKPIETTPKPTEKPTETPTETPTTTPVQDFKAEIVALGGYSATAEAGDEITITAVVQNTGGVDIPAGTGLDVDISIDGNKVNTVRLTQAIPANACATVETKWTATIGGHELAATMDGSSISKKLNVTRKINRNFTETSGVDLVVTDVGYYNETTGTYNSDIKEGDHIRFIAYGANAGSDKGPDNTKYGISFRVNDAGIGQATWCDNYINKPGMPAGSTYDFLANGGDGDKAYWEAVNGTATVKAIIDDQNLIGESNEDNNEKTVTINVPNTVSSVVTDTPDAVSGASERLGEVTGLAVTKATEKRITISWMAASGASSYNIYRNGEYIGSTIEMSYVDSGTFRAGQEYTYTVKAVQYKAESSGETVPATPEAEQLEVKAYPVPNGLTTSSGITMTADGENVGVFRTRVSETHSWTNSSWESDLFSNVAIFDYEGGDAEVKITVSNKNVTSVSVRPVKKGLTATIEHQGSDSVITINMPEGKQGQYDIDLNNTAGHDDQIYLFTKEITEAPANVWKTIKSGELVEGHIEVPDDQTLYIEGGGRLEGYVHMGHNSKLIGRGVITQTTYGAWSGWRRTNPLSIGYEPLGKGTVGGEDYGRNNVDIEGISILDSTGWALNVRNSHDVRIKDVNIMTARANGDGITVQSSYNVTIDGCFLRTYDDSIVIKNYDNINAHDIKVTDCTIWTDLAQTLEIGWETDMSGTSGRDEAGLKNNDPKIYNVFYKDIYVLHNYHKPVLSIHNGDNVPIYHIAYKNIYIEHKEGAGDGMAGVIDRRIENHSAESWTTNWHDNGYIDDIWYYNVSDMTTGSGTGSNIHTNDYVADEFLGW